VEQTITTQANVKVLHSAAPSLIGIEACGSAPFWERKLHLVIIIQKSYFACFDHLYLSPDIAG